MCRMYHVSFVLSKPYEILLHNFHLIATKKNPLLAGFFWSMEYFNKLEQPYKSLSDVAI
jgi:hypothetical protein